MMVPTAQTKTAPSPKRPIRVLIVDDSALVRSLLTDILKGAPGIEVVGVAADAHAAREKIKQLNPDVLTLDVEMPKMDGITFLRNLMRLRPMPVVMVSSLTERGADVTLDALALGAVDYLSKPKIDLAATLKDYAEELIEKVRIAARASVRALDPRQARAPGVVGPAHSADAVLPKAPSRTRPLRTTDRVIAIGASTGGTEAIKEVLMRLPPDCPGVVIAQHIPKAFSTPFARRMNDCCPVSVCEAQDGQHLLPGHAYIAPGDRHLMLVRDGSRYVCRLDDGVPVNRHKPSVDVLFRSVAQNAGRNAIGVLLTGMGKDGARGLKEMLDSGSCTMAQDEATSVVWGMPGEAVALGAAQHVVPLESVAGKVLALAEDLDITRESVALGGADDP
ncbi:MAG TPA: chemotaxis response regulator protein-glutamate methylesterase [Steroidobacteraceae bacterium]|jgi:two-component system chemotaxis response regulator CheB|nr:chemotaxis response regulator protein-glutamate methylesterase [Steroidobacteraceae bacterium]